MHSIKEEIYKKIIKKIHPEYVLHKEIDLISYSCDASFYSLKPLLVVRPRNIEEIQFLFKISREEKIPVTIRAAGTSLSGQSVGSGILIDISHHWKNYSILKEGNSIILEPGLIGGEVNQILKKYQKKIGPDPASINSCMMGGILANNASGMCCGVEFNSYHTLKNIKAILPDGYVLNTFDPDCDKNFQKEKPVLYSKLIEIKEKILNKKEIYEKIRNKYKIKNTTGYSLNAFIDFNKPSEILAHLLIGSEGTLGFIAEAELMTINDGIYKYTGLICFENVFHACDSIPYLREKKAIAVELMDRAAIRSIENKEGIPSFLKDLPDEATVLLVEFESSNEDNLNYLFNDFINNFDSSKTIISPYFTKNSTERDTLWKIRKGLFPSVGAVREMGTTVIIEDIAFPLENLPHATIELQKLFQKHNYKDAIIFGHAKDGNLHFVIKQSFNTEKQILQYDSFIRDVVDMVALRYQGSLKAEHGTGRNMAPFIEIEWGKEIYEIMKEIKTLIDPDFILNPDVIITKNSQAHIENVKKIPVFSEMQIPEEYKQIIEKTDKCIECGFCESVCPSQMITSTPRKRIILARETLRNSEFYPANKSQFDYYFYHTCVKCGECEFPCPVEINTGNFVKVLLNQKHQYNTSQKIANITVKNFKIVESFIKKQITLIKAISKVIPPTLLYKTTKFLNLKFRLPVFFPEFSGPSQYSKFINKIEIPEKIDYYYFPSCITRTFGSKDQEIWQSIPLIAKELNLNIKIIDSTGLCCSQPYESKGYFQAQKEMKNQTLELLNTINPYIPIIIDNSSCSFSFKKNYEFQNYHFLDSIEWIDLLINQMPDKFKKIYKKIYIHNLCSTHKQHLEKKLLNIGKTISEEVTLNTQCCGFAGDKGIFFPEINETIGEKIKHQIHNEYDVYLSSNYTCELGLKHGTGYPFQHILHAILKSLQKDLTKSKILLK